MSARRLPPPDPREPTRADVLAAKADVRAAREEYAAGQLSFDELTRVVDHYLDLLVARALVLGYRLPRPSRASVLR
jgi:outer membrane protein TolC